jgi:hypothetical protein
LNNVVAILKEKFYNGRFLPWCFGHDIPYGIALVVFGEPQSHSMENCWRGFAASGGFGLDGS